MDESHSPLQLLYNSRYHQSSVGSLLHLYPEDCPNIVYGIRFTNYTTANLQIPGNRSIRYKGNSADIVVIPGESLEILTRGYIKASSIVLSGSVHQIRMDIRPITEIEEKEVKMNDSILKRIGASLISFSSSLQSTMSKYLSSNPVCSVM
eukprot:TRINITY_DN3784_c0_g1_i3.p1 TRINITY_DN3784_c0_g1~~TRINITY_DN3784_c0_g1_i3.p1  ORF type:complete len:150 (-),score=4.25 TRINITY_DN3784_c0_g1_i3:1-450(-)